MSKWVSYYARKKALGLLRTKSGELPKTHVPPKRELRSARQTELFARTVRCCPYCGVPLEEDMRQCPMCRNELPTRREMEEKGEYTPEVEVELKEGGQVASTPPRPERNPHPELISDDPRRKPKLEEKGEYEAELPLKEEGKEEVKS